MGRAIVLPENEGGLRGSDQIQAGRAGTWSQPGLIAEVRLKHAQTSLRPSAEIQARIGKGTECGRRHDVSHETIPFSANSSCESFFRNYGRCTFHSASSLSF